MEPQSCFWMSMVQNYEKLNDKHYVSKYDVDKVKYKTQYPQQSSSISESGSSFSLLSDDSRGSETKSSRISVFDVRNLDSTEQQYVAKLNDLINREQQMMKKIKNMEIREKAFINTLKKANQMYASLENRYKKQMSKITGKNKYEEIIQELFEKNKCLFNQLHDVKLELKQCMEKFQGPVMAQMEQERRKSAHLEKQLNLSAQEIKNKDSFYVQEVCMLQNKLTETNHNLSIITALNESLQKQVCSLSCKNNDLVKQQNNEVCILEYKNETEDQAEVVGSDSFLWTIARRLSKTITNINRCSEGTYPVPTDLRDTLRGIVNIADVVSKRSKINKNVCDNHCSASKSTLQETPKYPESFKNDEPERDTNEENEEIPIKLEAKEQGATNRILLSNLSDTLLRSKDEVSRLNKKTEDKENGKLSKDSIETKSKIEDLLFPGSSNDAQVLTQVQTAGGFEVAVETKLEMSQADRENVHVTAAFTASGILEVVTEGPAGIIETSMGLTSSGSVDIITSILDFPGEETTTEVLSIGPELSLIKKKISSAKLIFISDIPSDTLSAVPTEELTGFKESPVKQPPAEPLRKKLKDLQYGLDFQFDNQGGGEIEDYRVAIEISEPKNVGYGDKVNNNLIKPKRDKSCKTKILSRSSSKTDASTNASSSMLLSESSHLRISTTAPKNNEGGDVLISIRDIDTDWKIKKIKNAQVNTNFELGKDTFTFAMLQPAECDCDECSCPECSPRIMEKRGVKIGEFGIEPDKPSGMEPDMGSLIGSNVEGIESSVRPERVSDMGPDEVSGMESSIGTGMGSGTRLNEDLGKKPPAEGAHPPDCNCTDCVCAPKCASYPSDYETRIHPPGCDCVYCLCMSPPCSSQKSVPCGPCTENKHDPSCKCINCLLECGIRGDVNKKAETDKDDKTSSIKQNAVSQNETQARKSDIHNFKCKCSACKLACGDECESKANCPEPPVKETPQSLLKETPCVSKPPLTCETEKLKSKKLSDCDCDVCEDYCNNPTCARILKAQREMGLNEHDDNFIRDKLNDLKVSLNKIRCACAEAEESVCSTPCGAKGALLAFRNIIENLQEKFKDKDKVILDMIKEVKSKMDQHPICSLLSLYSAQNTENCVCSEDRTKTEDVISCTCSSVSMNNNYAESLESVSLSCCSCCIESEEIKDKNVESQPFYAFPDNGCPCSKSAHPPSSHDNGNRATYGTCPFCYIDKNALPSENKKTKSDKKHKDPLCKCSDSRRDQSKPDGFEKEGIVAMRITEMRKISDALLVKWSKPSIKGLVGYEVLIDGQVKSRIRSAGRNSALIHSISCDKPITVTVYAITSCGRCLPAAKAVFDV